MTSVMTFTHTLGIYQKCKPIPNTYNSNKDIDNILPSIMTRLSSIGVIKITTIDYFT